MVFAASLHHSHRYAESIPLQRIEDIPSNISEQELVHEYVRELDDFLKHEKIERDLERQSDFTHSGWLDRGN